MLKNQLFLIIALTLTTVPLKATDDLASCVKAAEKYAAMSNMDDLLQQTIQQAAASVPADHRQEFIKIMSQGFSVKEVLSISIDAMIEIFTTAELETMAEFYGSPQGRSIMKKLPQYIALIMLKMQEKMMSVIKNSIESKLTPTK